MTYSQSNPSADYKLSLEDARNHHRHSKTWSGNLMFRHVANIKALIDRVEAKSVLDYGCGKCVQYITPTDDGRLVENIWGVPVFKVDPAVPPDFKRPPFMDQKYTVETELPPHKKWDVVIVTHALGSIPLVDLRDWVIPLIHSRARKAIYVAENLNTPKKDKLFRSTVEKPREWTAEQWMELLQPKESTVEVEAWFRGIPGNDPRETGSSGPEFRRWPFGEDEK